ncbi:hypothetical protein [Saccharothrix lopnurensis]|uniref:Uncharacterized protein n=1 Tax=Saccharothrix lopnurensis TaxID=1670621 RepID=A0ABW1PFT7_9PSEU
MPPRSLVGELAPDGTTYTARPCARAGFPALQVAELSKALHRHHDGDVDRLVRALLNHDWESINPWAAGYELDTGRRTPFTPKHITPHRGIGYHLAESARQPITGRLTEKPDPAYRWLYLFDTTGLHVLCNRHDRRWMRLYDFTTAGLDPGQLTALETCFD